MKTKNRIFAILGLITLIVGIATLIDPSLFAMSSSGYSLAMYVAIGVPKPTGNPGVSGNKDPMITYFDFDDVIPESLQRDSKGVLIPQNIQMKPGKYMVQVYGTAKTINPTHNAEGDPDAVGFVHGLVHDHPGQSLEILEFAQNWVGKDIGVILGACDSNEKKVYGTKCAPLQLNPSGLNDDSKNASRFTLTGKDKSKFVPGIYQGTLTLEDVKATEAADSATIDVANGSGQYQLTDGTAAPITITDLDNPVDGGVYTLLGSGGTYPSVVDADATFILKNGTTWTADAGSSLTLKAFKSDAADFVFFEISRSV